MGTEIEPGSRIDWAVSETLEVAEYIRNADASLSCDASVIVAAILFHSVKRDVEWSADREFLAGTE